MMQTIIPLIVNIIELGLIYSLAVLSVHLTSNVIAFDDLAIEGTFAFSGALTALLLINGANPVLAIMLAMAGGALVGLITGILHIKIQMNNLITGIVLTTALFSINLKMAGANIVLGNSKTIFDICDIPALSCLGHVPLLLAIAIIVLWGTKLFLETEIGTLLFVVGTSPHMLTQLGKSINAYKTLCLVIAHTITGLAGCLFVQHIGLFSITGNIGTLVTALAGLIIARSLCRQPFVGLIIGALCYQAIIALTIELRIDPAFNKLITAMLVVALIALRKKNN